MDTRTRSSQPGGDYDLSTPVNSFVEVLGRVVRSPTEFFSSIPRRGNLLAPLVFALICTEISTILGGLLRLVWRTRAAGGFRFEGGGYGFGEFLASVILTPIGATIGLFILAGIAHLLVMLFVGSETTGRAALVVLLPIGLILVVVLLVLLVAGAFILGRLI